MYELDEEDIKPSFRFVESLNILELKPRIPMSSHSVMVGVLRAPREILLGLLLLELVVPPPP